MKRLSGGHGHKLTGPQRKLLKMLVKKVENPSSGPLNIVELCKEAGVSRRTWYRLVDDPSFSELLPDCLDFVLSQSLISLVAKVVERGLAGSAKHAELAFKLSGLLEDGQVKFLQVFNKGGGEQFFLTEEKIRAMIEQNRIQKRLKYDGEKKDAN